MGNRIAPKPDYSIMISTKEKQGAEVKQTKKHEKKAPRRVNRSKLDPESKAKKLQQIQSTMETLKELTQQVGQFDMEMQELFAESQMKAQDELKHEVMIEIR